MTRFISRAVGLNEREIMAQMSEKQIQRTRFRVGELQKRIAVLEATREDLERQIRKLAESVPEEEVEATEQRDGYVAYGSYAQSVIARKSNLRRSLDDIVSQTSDIAVELRTELDALDSYERIRARRMAQQAERREKRAG
ncbi:MAG: flagellar export protein FliJ [Pseudomonadota bacterium]